MAHLLHVDSSARVTARSRRPPVRAIRVTGGTERSCVVRGQGEGSALPGRAAPPTAPAGAGVGRRVVFNRTSSARPEGRALFPFCQGRVMRTGRALRVTGWVLAAFALVI